MVHFNIGPWLGIVVPILGIVVASGKVWIDYRQTRIEMLPIVTVGSPKMDTSHGYIDAYVIVTNAGKGPACDVTLDVAYTHDGNKQNGQNWVVDHENQIEVSEQLLIGPIGSGDAKRVGLKAFPRRLIYRKVQYTDLYGNVHHRTI